MENFEKKDDPHRFWNFEITHSENVIREMSKTLLFREQFDKQHGKPAKALLKSAMTAPLTYSLITSKSIELEKISLIDMPNLGSAC